MRHFKILLSVLLVLSLVFVLVSWNSNTNHVDQDPPCCDPTALPPTVAVTGSYYDDMTGECCITVEGAANSSFKLFWPGQSSPFCTGTTNGSGYAECCYSSAPGVFKKVCLFQLNSTHCEGYINPTCD